VAGVVLILVLSALLLIALGLAPLAMGHRNARPATRVVGTAAWLLSIGVLAFLVAGVVLMLWLFSHGGSWD
jgi:hypothetical protein